MTYWQMALAAALILASGCGGPAPAPPPVRLSTANFEKIQNGMSLVDVEQFLGSWTVTSPGTMVKIDGTEKRVDQYQWKRGEKQIEVNFVADKVVSKSAQ